MAMRPIDLRHLGPEHVICCWQVDDVLVDPGPESSMDTLLEALGDEQPRALLLTHIHFDHAGAAGALVREWPDVEVWVHERGARHLVDPTRLVASAKRLYGDDFDRLWGEVVPVPERSLRVLRGGESQDGWDVAYTPGHASHHVSYRHADSGWVFPGDTCGVRLPGSTSCWRRRRRPTSTSTPGARRSTRSRRGSPRRSPSRTSASTATSRSTSRGCARRSTSGATSRARPTAPATPRRCGRRSPTALGERERDGVRPGDAARGPVAGARPLLDSTGTA